MKKDDYINLDNLIKYDKGQYKGKINWSENIGKDMSGRFKGIDFEFKIIDYDKKKQKINIEYKNKIYTTYTSSLLGINLGSILGIKTKEYKFKIGDVVRGGINDFKIINTIRKETMSNGKKITPKGYIVKCTKCGYKDVISESNLKKGSSCRCCKNKIPVLGVNTIWDTDKFMIPIVGEDIAKTHVHGSSEFVKVTCPYCGKESKTKRQINRIYQDKGIPCICKDSITYPEKFIFRLLEILNIDFIYQLTNKQSKWVERKRYDFYFRLNNEEFIIEANGGQHPNTKYYNKKSFKLDEEIQLQNDIYKKNLALKNGIKDENYIVLDCSLSDKNFIKDEIIKSRLNEIFNLSLVDWDKCDEFALKNLVKEVCDYWNNKEDWETTGDLAKKFKLNKSTIRDYLKKGAKLDFCIYDTQTERKRGNEKSVFKKRRKVEVFDLNNNSLGVFESNSALVRESEKKFGVKFNSGSISHICKGDFNQHKVFKFKYVD